MELLKVTARVAKLTGVIEDSEHFQELHALLYTDFRSSVVDLLCKLY